MIDSKSTGGFYDAAIPGDNIPADAVEITATANGEATGTNTATAIANGEATETDTAIPGDNIPADAVEITVEEHQALLEGQSQGTMFYSATTGGFYTREIHGDNIPADAVEITEAEHAALIEGQSQGKLIVADENGRPILQDPPPPTPEQIIAQYTAAVQKRLDDFARTRGYDNILSAASYATSTNPKFAAEGQYAVAARDATWAKCYEILAEVQAGTRPMPSSYEDIEPLLPVLEWPV